MPFPTSIQSNTLINRIITQEDIDRNFEEYRKAIAFFRFYPDYFVDFLLEAEGNSENFKLYDFQRVMLRAMLRYQEANLTFSRGTSKSFINVLALLIKCILWPGTKATVCAATKEQSAEILGSKLSEVLQMIPLLNFEISRKTAKDGQIKVSIKNTSWLRNIATKGTTRGMRSTVLATEEIVIVNPDQLEGVVRPLLAIARRVADGTTDLNETTRTHEIILTSAGFKGSYAYSRLIANLIRMVTEPGRAIVLGGSYRVPILGGLQDIEWIRTQMLSSDFNPSHFQREFLSQWAAGSETAFFPADTFDRLRALQEPEFERPPNLSPEVDYIIGCDVGRLADNTEVTIIKRLRQKGSPSVKHIVNIVTYEKMSFPEQAINLKKLYNEYNPIKCVIDAAGLGVGLVDELVIGQIDLETGLYLPPWQVANDEKGDYLQFKTPDGIPDFLWLYKANSQFNTQMYGNLQTQLMTGKLRFLQEERIARSRIESSRAKRIKEMTEDERSNYLLPFYQTGFLKTQMVNLESHNEGPNLIMKQSTSGIKKDKVSSLGYALLYIKQELDDKELHHQNSTLDALLSIGKPQKSRNSRITFNNDRNYSKKQGGFYS